MPRIEVAGLVKTFRDQRALDGVGFDVAEGELFTLLGPSGCGKSTTLMSIAGFQVPDEGRIVVGADTVFDAARRVNVPAERRSLGIVFQSYAVWPHMTVFDNVAFPLKVRRVDRRELQRRVREVLELVDIAAYEKRYPHQLSGGQQQRVALGRALVYSPSVLLLDEPFSNLDAKLRERARTWVKDVQHRLGLTTVFVTHDQDEALSMSDRVLVMNGGVVQQVGSPEDVYRRPTSRFVAEFVGRVNLLTGAVAGWEAGRVRLQLGSTETVLVADSEAAPAPGSELTVAIRPEAVEVDEVRGDAAGENVFAARVRSVEFLGDHYEYLLDLDGLELRAQTAQLVPGDQVRVRIPAAASVVVGE